MSVLLRDMRLTLITQCVFAVKIDFRKSYGMMSVLPYVPCCVFVKYTQMCNQHLLSILLLSSFEQVSTHLSKIVVVRDISK